MSAIWIKAENLCSGPVLRFFTLNGSRRKSGSRELVENNQKLSMMSVW
jgi:hypothetical protein